MQESIRGGRDAFEYLHVRGVPPGRVFDYVQARYQRFPVRQDVEQAIGFTTPRDIAVTEERFRKVEMQFVDSRLERYIVTEDALASRLKDSRVLRSDDVVTRGSTENGAA